MSRENFDEILQFQRQLASRVVQENEMDLQLKMLEIFNSLVTDKNKQVSVAQIMTEAELQGVPEDQTVRILKTLEDMNYIKRSGPSHYRRA